jgi:hypothetical protein
VCGGAKLFFWCRGKRCCSTYQCHGVSDLGNDDLEGLNTISVTKIVVAETVHGISLKLLDDLIKSQGVSWAAHGLVALTRDMVVNGGILRFAVTHD